MRKPLAPFQTSVVAISGFCFVRYLAFLPIGMIPGFVSIRRAWPDAVELGFDGMKVLLVIGLLVVTYRVSLGDAWTELGLRGRAGVGLLIGVIAVLPMLVILAVFSSVNAQATILSMLRTGVGSSVAEETLYRGYLFRQLYRRAGVNFWLASLANGIPWAIGHLSQTSQTGLGLVAGTSEVLVTMTLAAALAAWVYREWNYNLWVLIGVHGFGNAAWMLLGENNHMAYGWLGNTVRLSTFLVVIAITVAHRRRKRDTGMGDRAYADVHA